MALLLESQGDVRETMLARERVVPDLQLKLPGLFGARAIPNTLKDVLVENTDTTFTPLNTHYPLDYVGIYAKTGRRLDHIYHHVHDYFADGGWQARVGAQLDAMPNFTIAWQGEKGKDNSRTLTVHWIGHTPSITMNTDDQLIEAELFGGRFIEPLPFIELFKKRGSGQEWLGKVFARSGVRMDEFTVEPKKNIWRAKLVHQRENREAYELTLPLVLQTNLVNGVQSRLGKRFSDQIAART
jgi:hypothetical protein